MKTDNRVLVSVNGVCEITSLSRTSIFKLRNQGQFPAEVRLGSRIAFVRSEVDAWVAQRIAERNTKSAA